MSWREHLCELAGRLAGDVVAWETVPDVRAALVDRMRGLSGEEAAVSAAMAWFVDSLDTYQRGVR